MRNNHRRFATIILLVAIAANSACDSGSDSSIDAGSPADDSGLEGLNPDLFASGSLVSAVTTESCVLSSGTQTTCYRIEIEGVPADREIGPFCPPTIFSDAEEGGIWFDGGGDVYDIDGDFIVNLINLYGDQNWLLYDPDVGQRERYQHTGGVRGCGKAKRRAAVPESLCRVFD